MNESQNSFRYKMELVFDGPVQRHHYTLKCLPRTNLRQQILRTDTVLLPAGCAWESRDAFGNREILGMLQEAHDRFSVQVEGEAILPAGENVCPGKSDFSESAFPESAEGCALYPEEEVRPEKLGIYRYPTPLTRAGEKIQVYYETLQQEMPLEAQKIRIETAQLRQQEQAEQLLNGREESISEDSERAAKEISDQAVLAVALMHRLHTDFAYQKAATDVTTTAEQAFLRGAGVCQDYAHIFISLLRLAGIPARYVTGMLRGEGESHAWVEAALGRYWYGLDPTNDCPVAGSHIKIGAGRDFEDCRISQGIFYGCGSIRQQQIVRVSVEQK